MKNSLQVELRKLLTIRSTYVVSGLALPLTGFIAAYVMGYKANLSDPSIFRDVISMAAQAVTIFLAIVSILVVAHEYRYNTIMYTLTASNSRTKVYLSKMIVIAAYALILMVLVCAWSLLLARIGLAIHGGQIVAQHGDWASLAWRLPFYACGYAMIAMIVAFLFRNVVAAFAFLFVVPGTVEQLLSLVLKDKASYLPFMSLERVVADIGSSHGKAALIFTVYIVVWSFIAWALFTRRDAN